MESEARVTNRAPVRYARPLEPWLHSSLTTEYFSTHRVPRCVIFGPPRSLSLFSINSLAPGTKSRDFRRSPDVALDLQPEIMPRPDAPHKATTTPLHLTPPVESRFAPFAGCRDLRRT